jgi:hypothetical protein
MHTNGVLAGSYNDMHCSHELLWLMTFFFSLCLLVVDVFTSGMGTKGTIPSQLWNGVGWHSLFAAKFERNRFFDDMGDGSGSAGMECRFVISPYLSSLT